LTSFGRSLKTLTSVRQNANLITGGVGFISQNLVRAWRTAQPDD
jgi:hypothetical protein